MALFTLLVFYSCRPVQKNEINLSIENSYPVLLSIDLLQQIKEGNPIEGLLKKIQEYDPDSLSAQLNNDRQKKSFWINIYNSHIQLLLSKNPKLYENRSAFFSQKGIKIATMDWSFDDIEHGILRRSAVKIGLGYVTNPFPGKQEKIFRLESKDSRIHFLLNCGAESCPKIGILSAENYEAEARKFSKQFLSSSSVFDQKMNIVEVSSLFSWFRGDFSGQNGCIELLKTYSIIPKEANPALKYSTYSWKLKLNNYYEKEP